MRSTTRTTALTLATLAALGLTAAHPAQAGTELITNGGFETGDLTGWTVTNEAGGSGTWYTGTGSGTPLNGMPTAGPKTGAHYAVTDQGGPGAHVLAQSVTVVPGASSVIFSFDQFVNDYGGTPTPLRPLDFNGGGTEYARVDLLRAGANPFSTASADILQTFYDGADPALGVTNLYTHYSFDITGLVGGGGTYTVRFAEADNQGNFNQGVDNVSLLATPAPAPKGGPAAVPEPSSVAPFALAGLGLLGLIWGAKRRRVAAV